jgi:Phosphotransferase enzyme family
VQAKRFKPGSYQLQKLLWDYGFQSDSPDGISVPEPIGFIPEWQMWLQQKVPSIPATEMLATPAGVSLSQRIAEAADKLHRAWIIPQRFHHLKDELAILHDRLTQVAQQFPAWQARLTRVLTLCDRLAAMIPPPCFRGIHRDFYPDQVLVDGTRLYLLDFDLFAGGDPGLDIGNFNGHLIEHGLRLMGSPTALADQQSQLTEKFMQISEGVSRQTIEAYTTLTLVRHIYLSTQFADRRSFTEAILDHCEQRLIQAIGVQV